MFPQSRSRTLLLALGILLCGMQAWGCSVPVFRYALEHWPAAPFQAFVFHRGPLTAAQQSAVRDLGAEGLAGALHANISVRTVDLDQNPPAELLEFAPDAGAGSLPWLVVKFPSTNRRSTTIWSGPLNPASVAQMLDSPARREIVQRLTDGQSAVWLLLESGDVAADAAASQLLEERLKYLASVLDLPKLEAQDIANGLVSVGQEGLRLEFSILRLARNDPGERPLIQMLLGTEADLESLSAPIVFPVFGQGRALYALAGDGIRDDTIERAATFLIGKCSCEVKELNPGMDLLLSADWKSIVESQTSGIPDLPTMAELTKAAPETVTISSNGATSSPGVAKSEFRPLKWTAIGTLVLLSLLTIGAILQRKK